MSHAVRTPVIHTANCANNDFDYINKLYMVTLSPIVLSVVLIIVMIILKRGSFSAAVRMAATPFLTLTFLVFIATSSVVLSFFKHDKFEDLDKAFLEADYSVDISGAVHDCQTIEIRAAQTSSPTQPQTLNLTTTPTPPLRACR